jgi:formate dehydrogenase beta subunit
MAQTAIETWSDAARLAKAREEVHKRFPGRAVKAVMGWEGIALWDQTVDPVDLLDAYLKRAAAESCGQCTPCRLGTAQLAQIIDDICNGRGRTEDADRIRGVAEFVSATARCDIGRTLARPVVDLLDRCAADFKAVIEGRRPVRRGNYGAVVTAPCVSACPSHVDIPAYIEDVRLDRWPQGIGAVRRDCPMPGTIGRVCVRPCEKACRRGRLDEPVAIRAIKRFLADQEMSGAINAEPAPAPRKPQKVAIVGAGPAGLSCAYYLGRRGYSCTIFEAQEGPGGMAAYGIPSYRLPRDVIAHETALVERQGTEIRYGVKVGEQIRLEEMAAQGFGAIFLGVGAPESSKMRCEGEEAGYRCFMTGVQFLADAARGRRPLQGKRLLVIGGGNVAMDCVRTARRLGFDDVNLLYRRTEAEMPADPQEVEEAKEEGVHFHHLVAPVAIEAANGAVTGLKCQRMELGAPDASGRRSPVPIEGSEFVIPCDAIIPAVGQVCVVDCVLPDADALTRWKTLVVDKTTFQSEKKHIFGGGDCVTGPATLIAALAAGKDAARFIAQYLEKGQCTPDTEDVLQSLVGTGKLFAKEEEFDIPGISTRMHPEVLAPETRVNDFEEVEKGFTMAQAHAEAVRCLRCYRILVAAV